MTGPTSASQAEEQSNQTPNCRKIFLGIPKFQSHAPERAVQVAATWQSWRAEYVELKGHPGGRDSLPFSSIWGGCVIWWLVVSQCSGLGLNGDNEMDFSGNQSDRWSKRRVRDLHMEKVYCPGETGTFSVLRAGPGRVG
jgi:hypothetical protein